MSRSACSAALIPAPPGTYGLEINGDKQDGFGILPIPVFYWSTDAEDDLDTACLRPHGLDGLIKANYFLLQDGKVVSYDGIVAQSLEEFSTLTGLPIEAMFGVEKHWSLKR